MKIRDFKPSDAAQLATIFHDAVHVIGRTDYTTSQINAWSPAPVSVDRFLGRVSDGRAVFVAADETDTALGFIELEADGHIDCFYCHPDFARAGVGAALYARLENTASEAGMQRLYVEASEAARRFFLKAGFTCIKRREFTHNGIEIHNYLMDKTSL